MTPLGFGIGFGIDWRRGGSLLFKYAPGFSYSQLGGSYSGPSSRTYIDQNGVLQTLGPGVLREWDHYINGVPTTLLEGPRTTSFLNSTAPATHTSPALGAGTYVLWLVGSGSIAVAAGTATITGAGTATSAAPVVFTVTVAGTVTFTVTGSITRAQCENGPFATSFISSAGAATTRQADSLSFPWPWPPQASTLYVNAVELGSVQTAAARVWEISNSTDVGPRVFLAQNAGVYRETHQNANGGSIVTSAAAAAPAIGNTVELRALVNTDGSIQLGQSINGAAEAAPGASGGLALAAAWASPTRLYVGSSNDANAWGFIAIVSIKVAAGIRSLADMRAA